MEKLGEGGGGANRRLVQGHVGPGRELMHSRGSLAPSYGRVPRDGLEREPWVLVLPTRKVALSGHLRLIPTSGYCERVWSRFHLERFIRGSRYSRHVHGGILHSGSGGIVGYRGAAGAGGSVRAAALIRPRLATARPRSESRLRRVSANLPTRSSSSSSSSPHHLGHRPGDVATAPSLDTHVPLDPDSAGTILLTFRSHPRPPSDPRSIGTLTTKPWA
ncbi:hypothetical protein HETIRDRAFT_102227 [Heterobasidion irregulare TC 32-1]|uniref:Uncharacterized protein n=1 Tax=Heterobasidion irregulare (strain TC 32-1) TaxID=747525 RepID=W4K610_HETIT|nr:uncharacterized protein HETIRDRAFT_102227 [Heterobasidion irregulare TC 32-1]ETW81209.1 hypothetical protein HETIRDRAFT_102227 [Heterobasidion irregulare TC 32-1]